ncbi:hypothetical protein DAPPUDRAFT_254668 [Daphnia pulex]|uniref:Uncharacterized protein n=1 Tax=Daphnia pulex TaxID=6669 RepID=E9H7K9_DAPPU|nr:hypothetical protein DAPPUDRAFT_254668 [Daphnia pulex]|eukprot:EFX72204.1 hypothetical protein DAPPUDRAFT_254668 [Daphnia pulex]
MNRSRERSNTRDRYRLRSVRNIRTEPEQRRPRYTKPSLQTREKCRVIHGIKCSTQVEKSQYSRSSWVNSHD